MGHKIPRLEQIIKFKVANVLQRDLADPRLGLLTVTQVTLARDLSQCVIKYSVLGSDGDRANAQRLLDGSSGYIKREVARILRTRRAPQLSFEFDESIEGSIRIAETLRRELSRDSDEESGDSSDSEQEESAEERDSDDETLNNPL